MLAWVALLGNDDQVGGWFVVAAIRYHVVGSGVVPRWRYSPPF